MSNQPTQGSQGSHVPYAVIPLLAIIGAGAFVMICYVLYRHRHDADEQSRSFSDEQEIYMRAVRQRNREDIEALTGYYKARREVAGGEGSRDDFRPVSMAGWMCIS